LQFFVGLIREWLLGYITKLKKEKRGKKKKKLKLKLIIGVQLLWARIFILFWGFLVASKKKTPLTKTLKCM
jgi:hypothetical protein